MASPAAITGDYTDLRFVKGRKVCQVVIEIPIEAGEKFVKAFGTPNPATGVPVAIARLDPKAAEKANAAPKETAPPKAWRELKMAQRAGILCGTPAFHKYLTEDRGYSVESDEDAAEAVREICGVLSRAELDVQPTAAERFNHLDNQYRAWFQVAA